MSISAKELAKKLNMSAATVSMVLNNKPGISMETRERVLTAAEKHGYDFSKLKQKSKSTVQLVIYKKNDVVLTDTPFFAQLIEGIEKGCRENELSLQITYYYKSQGELKTDCDGILVLGTEMKEEEFEIFNKINVPIVIMDTYFDNLDYDFVTINNERGIALAINEFVRNGYKEIGYLHSSYYIVNFDERASGYYNNMQKNNLPVEKEYTHLLSPSVDGAYNDMKKLLQSDIVLAKAYVADNDLVAAGAIKAFKEKGLKIPEDVAIIGFDNMPICDILEPRLATVDVPKQGFGLTAVHRLIHKMNNKDAVCVKIMVAPSFAEGGSLRFKED